MLPRGCGAEYDGEGVHLHPPKEELLAPSVPWEQQQVHRAVAAGFAVVEQDPRARTHRKLSRNPDRTKNTRPSLVPPPPPPSSSAIAATLPDCPLIGERRAAAKTMSRLSGVWCVGATSRRRRCDW